MAGDRFCTQFEISLHLRKQPSAAGAHPLSGENRVFLLTYDIVSKRDFLDMSCFISWPVSSVGGLKFVRPSPQLQADREAIKSMPIKAGGSSTEASSKYLLMILTSSEVKETRTGQLKDRKISLGPGRFSLHLNLIRWIESTIIQISLSLMGFLTLEAYTFL